MTQVSSVTLIPISSFGSADALDGTEQVPIVQDGVTRKATTSQFASVQPDMPTDRVKGRISPGAGQPENLTAEEVSDNFVVPGRNLIGFQNVPVLAASSRTLLQTDDGKGIVQAALGDITITVPEDTGDPETDLVLGHVTTLAVMVDIDTGNILIVPSGAVAIINLGAVNPTETGSFIINGQGIAMLWKVGENLWAIHGSNVAVSEE